MTNVSPLPPPHSHWGGLYKEIEDLSEELDKESNRKNKGGRSSALYECVFLFLHTVNEDNDLTVSTITVLYANSREAADDYLITCKCYTEDKRQSKGQATKDSKSICKELLCLGPKRHIKK